MRDGAHYPHAETVHYIKRFLPKLQEALEYCLSASLDDCERGDPLSIDYDVAGDQLVFHHRVSNLDRELVTLLHDVTETWIVMKSGVDCKVGDGVVL